MNPEFYGECGNMSHALLIGRYDQNLNLKGANLNASYFYVSRFEGGDYSSMALRESRIIQASFKDLKAQYLDLRGAHIKSAQFENINMSSLLATGTRFNKTKFKNCNLKNANFWGSNLQESDFEGSDLSGANLKSTFLLFTQFKGARFDNETQLPFSEEEAIEKGMIKVDSISEDPNPGN